MASAHTSSSTKSESDVAAARSLPVTASDCLVLAFLDEHGGYLARRIAEEVFGGGRAATTAVGGELRRLARLGLASPLDDQKPVCWKRTADGTRMLRRAASCGLYEGEVR